MTLRSKFGVALGLLCALGQAMAAPDWEEATRTIETALARWEIPGAAVVVVHQGKVVYERGFGFSDLASRKPVDLDTLFPIASNTKGFTTAATAILAAEGRLSWDDPVIRHLPEFALSDPTLAPRVTLRDLASHRIGLPTYGGDLLWWNSNYTRADILARLRYIPVTGDFRATYAYCNLAFVALGEVVARAGGVGSWEDFIQARLLDPLKMTRTYPTLARARAKDASALITAYSRIGEKLTPVALTEMDAAAPAGGMVSNARDYAAWLQFQLNEGAPLLPAGAMTTLRTPHVLVPISAAERARIPETVFRAAGLGWFIRDYRGSELFQHNGALDGAFSSTSFFPATRTGVAVFTNRDHHTLATALNYYLQDLLLGAPFTDWSERFRAAAIASAADETEPESGIAVSAEEIVGSYETPLYGEARIAIESGATVLTLSAHPRERAILRPGRGNLLIATWSDPVWGKSAVRFEQGFDGTVSGFRLSIRPDWIDELEYAFARKKEKKP